MRNVLVRIGSALLLVVGGQARAPAWDYEGHRIINQLALASLPTNFPSFALTPAASERIAFLSGEPDRWRNTPDLPFKHSNGLDHYLDLEELDSYELEPASLPAFRYDFAALLAKGRAAHPEHFPPIDPAKDADHTRSLIGFLPWTITEDYAKLKSGFSYLKVLEEGGAPEEVANAHENIIYVMGVMGHFVGDGAQPLHTTRHHHGWVGKNPFDYNTNFSFHAWIDGGYIHNVGLKTEDLLLKVRPARQLALEESGSNPTNIFPIALNYLIQQQRQVEPLYQLEKAKKLSSHGDTVPEGYDFITGQMLKGAQMLGDFWLTAWQHAPPDRYLKDQLARRKAAADAKASSNEESGK